MERNNLKNNNQIAELFSMISNTKRRNILDLCDKRTNSIYAISEELDDSIQNISKHIQKIQKFNLLEVNEEKQTYQTSRIGNIVVSQIKTIKFVENNKDYFLEHDIGDVPTELLNKLENLCNSEFFSGVYMMFSYWSKIANNAEKYFSCIFSTPPVLIADTLVKKISEGLSLNILFGKNSTITQCNEFVDRLALRKRAGFSNIEKRMTESVKVNLIMSEKEACLMFPGRDGNTDIHGNFVSKDSKFLNWCQEFFEYKWKSGEKFSRLR